MAHEKGGGTSARSAGHWWSKPSEEPFKIQELNEDIYGDFMLRGLKIANQRQEESILTLVVHTYKKFFMFVGQFWLVFRPPY